MPLPNGMRIRNACSTTNNPPADENISDPPPLNARKPTYDAAKMQYLGFALERGATGTVHWQGYMELKSPTSLNTVKVLLGGSAHIEQVAYQLSVWVGLPVVVYTYALAVCTYALAVCKCLAIQEEHALGASRIPSCVRVQL